MINFITRKPYQGGNADTLQDVIESQGFQSIEFGTFIQFKNAGRMVQKGQKGVKLCKPVEKEYKDKKTGKVTKKTIVTGFTVFNLEQTEVLAVEEVAA